MKRFLFLLLQVISIFILNSEEVISFTFAGDLMAHDVNYKTAPLSDIYKGVRSELINDDLSFINLEFPIDETIKQSSYPAFNVHPGYVEAAIDGGFDVFSLANNHTNDYGIDSVLKTVDNMEKFQDKESVIYSGVFREDKKGFRVEVIQVKDIKVGFIAMSEFNNNYWNKAGAKKIYITDYKNSEHVDRLEKFIKSIDEQVDCLILSYHGGAEYKQNPSEGRKEFFSRMIDAGVDILWGHHPHVLQPWYKQSREDGDKLVMYSLGNFVSGQLAIVDPENHNINFAATGFSSLFKVDVKMEDGKLKILKAEPKMIANVRNENNYFVTVFKSVALGHPMNDKWKEFYKKMFPLAEYRVREEEG